MTAKPASKAFSSIGTLSKGVTDAPVRPVPKTIDETKDAKQTVFIPRKVHKRLKEICLEKNISQQQIFMAALDLYLKQEGEPSISELEGHI